MASQRFICHGPNHWTPHQPMPDWLRSRSRGRILARDEDTRKWWQIWRNR